MPEEKQSLFTPKIDAAQVRKKPHLEALLFCQYFSQDKEGKNNIMGTFDRLFVDPKTLETGVFFIFARTGETRQGDIIVSIINPNNVVAANLTYSVPEHVASPDLPLQVQFCGQVGFKIKMEGSYWIDVSYEGESLGGAALTVKFRESEDNKNEHEGSNT